MPTPTTRLGLSKPLGNETVSRAAYSAVLDEIDAGVAGLAVCNEFQADQGIGARGTADSGVTGYDSYDDYLQGSVWDGSASAPRYRRFVRRVKATPSASYLQLAYQAEGAAEIPLIEISAAGALRPATEGGGSLGEADRRWGAAYVQTLDISGGATLANAAYLKAKDSGGTPRNVIGVDVGQVLQIGDGALAAVALNLGSTGHFPSSTQVSIYDNTTRTIFRSGRSRFDFFRQDATGWADVYVGKLQANDIVQVNGAFRHANAPLGFYGANPVAKQTVTGSRGGNAALASLLTALANLGLITDSTAA